MSFPLMPNPTVQFAAPTLSFTASFNTSNNYTTTTWTAVAIGAAASNRSVIVSLHTDPGTVTPDGRDDRWHQRDAAAGQ